MTKLQRIISTILLVSTSLAGAFAFVCAFGGHKADIGFMRVRFSVLPSARGKTILATHPFGEVTAYTHNTPLSLVVGLDRIHGESVQSIIDDETKLSDLIESMKNKAQEGVRAFIVKILALSALGGVIGATMGRRLNLKALAGGAVIGVAFATIVGVYTFSQFDASAFNRPSYSGLINYAPDIVSAIEKSVRNGKDLRQYVREMVANLSSLYIEMDQYGEKDGNERKRILHVSDIHNNPLSGDFIKVLVKGLSPDLILNTGDMTDMGSEIELRLTDSLKNINLPHFYVSGNHDSEQVTNTLKNDFGIYVLNDEAVKAGGLLIMGYGDPKGRKSFDADATTEEIDSLVERIRNRISKMKKTPDVLMVHNPDVAEKLAGQVPLIISGHSHRISSKMKDGTIIVVAGTTGAAGLRYMDSENRPSYSAALITAHRTNYGGYSFDFVDLIQMNQKTGEFQISRKSYSSGTQADTENIDPSRR